MTAWKWKFETQGDDVPKFTLGDTLMSQAVDRCEVEIPAREKQGVKVSFLDTCNHRCIEFIAIQLVKDPPAPGAAAAPAYSSEKRVLYRVEGQPATTFTRLDNAHFIMGRGFIRLLQWVPLTLTFWNERDTPVKIVIAVARNVDEDCGLPEPPPKDWVDPTTPTPCTPTKPTCPEPEPECPKPDPKPEPECPKPDPKPEPECPPYDQGKPAPTQQTGPGAS